MTEEKFDFTIDSLGPCTIQSPIKLSLQHGDFTANYVSDDSYVINNINIYNTNEEIKLDSSNLIQKAGPREKIYFDPKHAKAGICTCGGLCPGLNDVIRAVVRCLNTRYGVKTIKGYQYGYHGFFADSGYEPIELDRYLIDEIHKIGGTYLGTSRGGGTRTSDIVDCLERDGINMLFIIGGDGTQRGAYDVACEVEKRGMKCAVVGIPKTVDNDLMFIDRSFGFETAVQRAKESIAAVHMEAASQIGGVGLVKLMGRESGFIATAASLASHETNFCLIPEVPFELEGENGFLACLERRLAKRGHAVIVVAEGAGQDLLKSTNATDASGNKKLADIGIFLKAQIEKYFKEKQIEINLKYIDPSYQVRASVTTASDSIYCERLGNNAVHAAMAGKTKLVIGLVHDKFVHLPIKAVTAHRNAVDPEGSLWRDALDATGQPVLMVNDLEAAHAKMAAAVAGAKSKPSEQKKTN